MTNNQEFRNYLAAGIACNTLWPGKNEIDPPVLAARQTWYKGATDKATITSIKMANSYTPTGNETESWTADDNGTSAIMCYVNGTELTIAGNGSGKIMANKDSDRCFSGFKKCTEVTGWTLFDTSNVTSMSYMFYQCHAFTSLDLSNFDTSNVTSMSYMFYECVKLVSLNISNFDTSNVTSMTKMFVDCNKITSLDLSNFDTSNVKYMDRMFQYCLSFTSLDLSKFDTSNVLSMSYMFNRCDNLINIYVGDKWVIDAVRDTTDMFLNCGTDHVTYV